MSEDPAKTIFELSGLQKVTLQVCLPDICKRQAEYNTFFESILKNEQENYFEADKIDEIRDAYIYTLGDIYWFLGIAVKHAPKSHTLLNLLTKHAICFEKISKTLKTNTSVHEKKAIDEYEKTLEDIYSHLIEFSKENSEIYCNLQFLSKHIGHKDTIRNSLKLLHKIAKIKLKGNTKKDAITIKKLTNLNSLIESIMIKIFDVIYDLEEGNSTSARNLKTQAENILRSLSSRELQSKAQDIELNLKKSLIVRKSVKMEALKRLLYALCSF
jgi:hypothetical protein